MKPKSPEPGDVVTQLERAEIRAWLRNMKSALDVAEALTSTSDLRILEAALSAPPQLSGIDNEQIAEQVENHYVKLTFPHELDEVETLQRLADEAAAVAQSCRGELRRLAEIDEREFTRLCGPAESRAALPWIIRDGARVLVIEINPEDNSAS